jgi:hypothetical protein
VPDLSDREPIAASGPHGAHSCAAPRAANPEPAMPPRAQKLTEAELAARRREYAFRAAPMGACGAAAFAARALTAHAGAAERPGHW